MASGCSIDAIAVACYRFCSLIALPGARASDFFLRDFPDSPAKQRADDRGINEHFCKVVLARAHPEKMQQCQQRDHIDDPVQRFPAHHTQPADRAVERCSGQWRQQQQRKKPDQDERPLDDIGQHFAELEAFVEPRVADEMQQCIEVRKQPEHPGKAHQLRRVRQLSQQRDREHHTQQSQRPVTRGAAQVLGRIGTQPIGQRAVEKPAKRQQQQRKQDHLRLRFQEPLAHR